MATGGGGNGSANAVRAGEAFVEVTARNAKLKAALDQSKQKLNQFAESSKKTLAGLGAAGGVGSKIADSVGGLGGLAGVAGLGAAGVGGLAGVGAIGLVHWTTGLKEFQAEFAKLTESVVKTAETLRQALAGAAGRAVEENDLKKLQLLHRTARQVYETDAQAVEQLTVKLAQARREQTGLGTVFAGVRETFGGAPHEVDALTKQLEVQEKILGQSSQAFQTVNKQLDDFKKKQKAATDETRKAIAERKAAEAKTVEGVTAAAREVIATDNMTQLEKEIREVRKPFPDARLQAMEPRERNEIEDRLREAEVALREADRIRNRPEAVRKAFRDAFGGAPPPQIELGQSQGAFTGPFKQVLGGSMLDKKQLTELERQTGLLKTIANKRGGVFG